MSYALVIDSEDVIRGIWLKDEDVAANPRMVAMLLMKEGFDSKAESVLAVLADACRLVPNNSDERGGVFLMFDSTLAPGEIADREGGTINAKRCAACGGTVDSGVLECPKCGRSHFEVEKSDTYPDEVQRERSRLESSPWEDFAVRLLVVLAWPICVILSWFSSRDESPTSSRGGYVGSLEGLAALAGKGKCPYCGTRMERDQLGLRCDNGHAVVCRNALFSEYTTPSEEVARVLRAKGVPVVVLP